jgi:hypothetical protein
MSTTDFLTTHVRMLFRLAFIWLIVATVPAFSQGTWVNVWNGRDSTGLYKAGTGTFTFVGDSIIRLSNGSGSNNSYFATKAEYTHYRVRFDWKNPGGNTGFLFHILQDRFGSGIWPLGLECQTHSGNDPGSLWTTGCRFNSRGIKNPNGSP